MIFSKIAFGPNFRTSAASNLVVLNYHRSRSFDLQPSGFSGSEGVVVVIVKVHYTACLRIKGRVPLLCCGGYPWQRSDFDIAFCGFGECF
ncbi:hypothetical protein Ahy_A06g027391 isoform A [Arachis hypogaea]|uniref:Uncharacterized protein n=1 Tax=Arachis hypogaea TaxID=3818 RepID=A0A445CNJ0_ARAHY|nr:hypothetical protein Ahy_A06g027391 isoform A [Arachis hypogaea]